MKFVLNLFALILLGSMAQASELRWIVDKNGCKLHLPVGYSNGSSIEWYGNCDKPNKIANGNGFIRFSPGAEACSGTMDHGSLQGKITCEVRGRGEYIIIFDSGVPTVASFWDLDNNATYIAIDDDGTLTTKVISENEAAVAAGKLRKEIADNESDNEPIKNQPEKTKSEPPKKHDSAKNENPSSGSVNQVSTSEQCSTDIEDWTWNYNTGEVYRQERPLDPYMWFNFSAGEDANWGPYPFKYPKLSIATPIDDLNTLYKLKTSDWMIIRNLLEARYKAEDNYREDDIVKNARANARKSQLSVLGCFANRSSKSLKNNLISASKSAATSNKDKSSFNNRDCIDFGQPYKDGISDSFKTIHNRCGVPVSVMVCYYDPIKDRLGCPDPAVSNVKWGLTDVIENGDDFITADVVGTKWNVKYLVCEEGAKRDGCRFPTKAEPVEPRTKSSIRGN